MLLVLMLMLALVLPRPPWWWWGCRVDQRQRGKVDLHSPPGAPNECTMSPTHISGSGAITTVRSTGGGQLPDGSGDGMGGVV